LGNKKGGTLDKVRLTGSGKGRATDRRRQKNVRERRRKGKSEQRRFSAKEDLEQNIAKRRETKKEGEGIKIRESNEKNYLLNDSESTVPKFVF